MGDKQPYKKFSNFRHASPAVPPHGTGPAPPALAVLEPEPHERRLEGLEGAKLEPPADLKRQPRGLRPSLRPYPPELPKEYVRGGRPYAPELLEESLELPGARGFLMQALEVPILLLEALRHLQEVGRG